MDDCVAIIGHTSCFEEMLLLNRLFVPKPQGRGTAKKASDLNKLRPPFDDEAKVLAQTMNTARDLAMVRHLHDHELGTGYTVTGRGRTTWLLTRDAALADLYDNLPRPVGAHRGRIAYAIDDYIAALPLEEKTAKELRALYGERSMASRERVDHAPPPDADQSDVEELLALCRELAAQLIGRTRR
jgi:hypothetical protein